jgi:hypothetical protein
MVADVSNGNSVELIGGPFDYDPAHRLAAIRIDKPFKV